MNHEGTRQKVAVLFAVPPNTRLSLSDVASQTEPTPIFASKGRDGDQSFSELCFKEASTVNCSTLKGVMQSNMTEHFKKVINHNFIKTALPDQAECRAFSSSFCKRAAFWVTAAVTSQVPEVAVA